MLYSFFTISLTHDTTHVNDTCSMYNNTFNMHIQTRCFSTYLVYHVPFKWQKQIRYMKSQCFLQPQTNI